LIDQPGRRKREAREEQIMNEAPISVAELASANNTYYAGLQSVDDLLIRGLMERTVVWQAILAELNTFVANGEYNVRAPVAWDKVHRLFTKEASLLNNVALFTKIVRLIRALPPEVLGEHQPLPSEDFLAAANVIARARKEESLPY
jgi:hypothetical protein